MTMNAFLTHSVQCEQVRGHISLTFKPPSTQCVKSCKLFVFFFCFFYLIKFQLIHSQLLLELRDRLVSREGLPFFWDTKYSLLCGMNGHQKSELARSVTHIRDKLRTSTFDPLLFRYVRNFKLK